MKKFHCSSCGKVLFEGNITHGVIKKKCKCGTMNTIEIKPADQAFQERLDLAKK